MLIKKMYINIVGVTFLSTFCRK